jgi:dolichyl-phosphate beta-glucosyltransferase
MTPRDLTPVSVVVPAYNESRRLPALFDALEGGAAEIFEPAGLRIAELIVVDDGSTDETRDLLEARRSSHPELKPIRLERNRGKGAAVRTGMLAAGGPLALLSDADMATPFEEVQLLAAALDQGTDIAIGSRGLPESHIVVHQPKHRELAGKTFNLGLRLLTGLPYRDTQCGFKLFRLPAARPLFEHQRIDGFAYDAEVLVLARKHGLRVAEVPVRWFDDPNTTVKLFSASGQMALDLLRVAAIARRPSRASRRAKREQASPADRPM